MDKYKQSFDVLRLTPLGYSLNKKLPNRQHRTKSVKANANNGRKTGATLSTFLRDEWLPRMETEVEPTTFQNLCSHIDRFICPELGDIRIEELRKDMVEDFYRRLLNTPKNRGNGNLSKSSVIRVHATLHWALEALVQSGRLSINPARGARPRRRKCEWREVRVWTPQQLSDFLEVVSRDALFPLWRLLAWTGMRRGEALGLQWMDFRFDVQTVVIRRSLLSASGHMYLSSPKSAHTRVVELDEGTVKVLRRHQRRQRTQRKHAGLGPATDDGFVFSAPTGKPIQPSAVSKKFLELVIASGLPRIRLHDLRHTHASHLIMSGVNMKAVQERLGHADVVITLNLYSHVLPTIQREGVRRLSRFYEEGGDRGSSQ